ncbi:MAG: acetate kinase [Spiroplasma poulsonii]|uniref:Acetate kinase n=1 Tax=Spiroplasma poulsonii TaxID=2138 RepID=A0A2P6FEW5_9MOLU|nr:MULTISPECIES: acetate kinase [Spiroplasma]KAF0850346.1 Acetate kinase [Spiroplasma poulsonii]MBH8622639.1 acetate kinase [Spiroplasma sp. hyd1]MBW1242270.1 acetate kinase [Spiroplasma poulsonii]PQM31989.1 Acetate kinase [Spiroplasma poulsonii]PWF94464.1 Acetate kinase [Spiroplasma poulsonii]
MILVINAGSSSMKFQLYKVTNNNYEVICKGLAERINIDGIFTIKFNGQEFQTNEDLSDHSATAKVLIAKLKEHKIIQDFSDIQGIGHRIVHGGEKFTQSTVITDEVFAEIKRMVTLAPLHNPPAIAAIEAFRRIVSVPNVAVFDTSFHTTIPEENYLYSVPYEWYTEHQVRRYGFHGISYRYITKRLREVLQKPAANLNAIICHLGNGASVCAVKNGKSFNTSMGLTPLEGLIMGTRSGDIDPSIHQFIASQTGASLDDITNTLNKKSGLLGISGVSSDLRDVFKSSKDNSRSQLALTMSAKRIAKYIVDYANDLGTKLDAVVFTAGIGENSSEMRQLVINEVKLLNLELSTQANQSSYENEILISTPHASYPVYAMRTNEEVMICEDTYHLINK